jgi:hypothetical protein
MTYRNTIAIFLFFMACRIIPANAQEAQKWEGTGIEVNAWAGKMIRHTKNLTGPLPDYSTALELNIIKQTYGQKAWQQRRNYPQVGLGFIYINYRNPEVYGSVIGIYPNIQLPIIRKESWEWSFRAGMGVGYDTRPYERMPRPNLENPAIGGHWNNVSPFATDLRWKVNKHLEVQTGLSFVHVSNASFQQPNLGINMWGGHLGIRYFPVTGQPEKIKRDLSPLKNRWLFSGRAGMAFVEKNPADGPLYPVYLASVFASKRYWSKNKAFAGFSYTYNSGMYAFLKDIGDFRDHEKSESYQAAVFLGNEFLLGHVGVVFQLGFYLKEMYKTHHIIYEKLGGNYYFYKSETGLVKEVFASAFLKTHKFEAEFFEMGLGCSF